MSRRDSDSEKVPAALYARLTNTPTYAAQMYKVQVKSKARGQFPGIFSDAGDRTSRSSELQEK